MQCQRRDGGYDAGRHGAKRTRIHIRLQAGDAGLGINIELGHGNGRIDHAKQAGRFGLRVGPECGTEGAWRSYEPRAAEIHVIKLGPEQRDRPQSQQQFPRIAVRRESRWPDQTPVHPDVGLPEGSADIEAEGIGGVNSLHKACATYQRRE
jgi:hypothetical protein